MRVLRSCGQLVVLADAANLQDSKRSRKRGTKQIHAGRAILDVCLVRSVNDAEH